MGGLFGGGGGGNTDVQTVQPPLKTDNAVQGPLGSLAVRQLGSQGAFAPFGRGSAFVPGVALGQVQLAGPNPTQFGNPGNAQAATDFFGSAGFSPNYQAPSPFAPQQQGYGGSPLQGGGGQQQAGGQPMQPGGQPQTPGQQNPASLAGGGQQATQQRPPTGQSDGGSPVYPGPYSHMQDFAPMQYQQYMQQQAQQVQPGPMAQPGQNPTLFPGINLFNPFLTNYTPQSNNGMYGTAGFPPPQAPQPQQQQPPASGSGGTQGATQ